MKRNNNNKSDFALLTKKMSLKDAKMPKPKKKIYDKNSIAK